MSYIPHDAGAKIATKRSLPEKTNLPEGRRAQRAYARFLDRRPERQAVMSRGLGRALRPPNGEALIGGTPHGSATHAGR